MIEEQPLIAVTPETLVAKTLELRDQGHRLVHLCATSLKEGIEMTYAFDRDGKYVGLRFMLPKEGARIPSITPVFWAAFIYENEIHDLFGVQIDGNALDFKGTFYKVTTPFPFANKTPAAAPAVTVAPAPAAAPAAAPATQPS